MRILYVSGENIRQYTPNSVGDYVKEIHRIAADKLYRAINHGKITSDMDGVMIHDDNAISCARIISGEEARVMYGKYAQKNIEAVAQGETAYCWFAPTLFVGNLLKGLSPEINRSVGRHMRLIPDAGLSYRMLKELNYDITAVTAGHQEAAAEVSRRLDISKTVGTQLGCDKNGKYDGTVASFIGGDFKRLAVEDILGMNGDCKGTHIGDAYSDVETLKAVPGSIAFNPGFVDALKGADISIISQSQAAIVPFFDDFGKFDLTWQEYDLPQTIVVKDGEMSDDVADIIMRESKSVKQQGLEVLLRHKPYGRVLHDIRKELDLASVESASSIIDFMSPEEFDKYARAEFRRLKNEVRGQLQ